MKLSYLFSDGMVLQRGKKNYIWGETSPEIIVAGILDGKKFNTKADTHGMLWQNFRIFRLVVRIVWK